jgi:hypothetical protein
MAFGSDTQAGGLWDAPDVADQGYQDWASMSGMQPGHPLVGGTAGTAGYGGGQRQVAVASQDPTAAAVNAAAAAPNWRQLFNLKGNPISWVAIASIAYLGLSHLSARGQLGRRKG